MIPTVDPNTESEEVEEPLPIDRVPANVRVALGQQVLVALLTAAGQVHGDLVKVSLAQHQCQLVVVHERGVGDI